MTEVELVYEQLKQVECPEDVFGTTEPINRGYRNILNIIHPDYNPEELDIANQAVKLLQDIHNEALGRLRGHTYGDRRALPWKAASRTDCYAAEEKC